MNPPSQIPNIIYGRILEAAHISGYGFERMVDELEWLLDGDRWQQVGAGYSDVNEFLRSIDLSAFNLTDKKKLHKRIKELQPDATVRAIGEATGTPFQTVQRHVSNGTTPPSTDASDQHQQVERVSNGTTPNSFERPAEDVAALSRQRSARDAKEGDRDGWAPACLGGNERTKRILNRASVEP